MADFGTQQRKLQILCLHGSRQDGEVFSQRLKTLQKKLKSIAVSSRLACLYCLGWGGASATGQAEQNSMLQSVHHMMLSISL